MRNLSRMAARLQAKDKFGVGCLALFALPFALVGVFASVMIGRALITWSGAQRWDETPARLTSVEMDARQGNDSSSSRVTAQYDYEYLGTRYTGKRVGIFEGADNIGHWQNRVYDELDAHFRAGEAVSCFVNPHRPSDAVLNRQMRWEMIGFLSVFAVMFGLVGFGLLIGSLTGMRRTRVERTMQAAHPSEPWRWKPEWADGVIRAGSKSSMIGAILFAVFWNAISIPLLFILPPEIKKGNRAAWVGLLFPLVGAGLIVMAVRSVIRWVKFGTSTLRMAVVPGVIGGRVAGVVSVPRAVQPANGFNVSLTCLMTVTTGSGKNRSTSEKVLWMDTHVMKAEPMRNDPMFQALPVLFAAPYDQPETTTEVTDGKVTWRLEVKADIPGVDYLVQFDLPVFKTADSSENFKLDEATLAKYEVRQDPATTLRGAGLILSQASGGSVVYFPMAMRPGPALAVTAFFAVWTGIVIILSRVDAPLIFPIVFGFFDVLIFFGVLDAWFGSARVEAGRGSISLFNGLLGRGKTRVLPVADIDRIEVVAGAQQGTAVAHLVRIHMKDGKTHDAGRQMAGRLEADALAGILRQSLN